MTTASLDYTVPVLLAGCACLGKRIMVILLRQAYDCPRSKVHENETDIGIVYCELHNNRPKTAETSAIRVS
jgi:hypothetical protein